MRGTWGLYHFLAVSIPCLSCNAWVRSFGFGGVCLRMNSPKQNTIWLSCITVGCFAELGGQALPSEAPNGGGEAQSKKEAWLDSDAIAAQEFEDVAKHRIVEVIHLLCTVRGNVLTFFFGYTLLLRWSNFACDSIFAFDQVSGVDTSGRPVIVVSALRLPSNKENKEFDQNKLLRWGCWVKLSSTQWQELSVREDSLFFNQLSLWLNEQKPCCEDVIQLV